MKIKMEKKEKILTEEQKVNQINSFFQKWNKKSPELKKAIDNLKAAYNKKNGK